MKISQQPTNHILVKATCQSEWDNCDFAVITCDNGWVEQMEKRLNTIALHSDDIDFASLHYYDGSVEFYVSKEDEVEKLLSETGTEKQWTFIELEENEEDEFDTPENSLDCRMQVLHKGGIVRYKAHGKHTGEEFYTESFSVSEVIKCMQTTAA